MNKYEQISNSDLLEMFGVQVQNSLAHYLQINSKNKSPTEEKKDKYLEDVKSSIDEIEEEILSRMIPRESIKLTVK